MGLKYICRSNNDNLRGVIFVMWQMHEKLISGSRWYSNDISGRNPGYDLSPFSYIKYLLFRGARAEILFMGLINLVKIKISLVFKGKVIHVSFWLLQFKTILPFQIGTLQPHWICLKLQGLLHYTWFNMVDSDAFLGIENLSDIEILG